MMICCQRAAVDWLERREACRTPHRVRNRTRMESTASGKYRPRLPR